MKYKNLQDRLFYNSVLTDTGCWEWLGKINNAGYGIINIRIEGKHKSLYVHRVSFECFVTEITDNLEVNHICDNRRCINPAHMELLTRQQNINYIYDKVNYR